MDEFPRTRVTGAFERRVTSALDRLVPQAERVLIACSGGPDSTATLVAVARSERPVVVAHFDHRMRSEAESEADRAAVASLAAQLDAPLVAGRGSGDARSEDDARTERYRWLASAAAESGATACVTGHTLDDQAETVLLRLTRGASLIGAAGMAESAPWPVDDTSNLRVVRPLLAISRANVERYLEALGLTAREDPSNADPAWARNRIRHHVIPEMRALNPRASESLAAFAERARADDAALEEWAQAVLASASRLVDGGIELDRAALRALPTAVATRVLRAAAARLGIALESSHLEAMYQGLGRRASMVALPRATLHVTTTAVVIDAARTLDAPGSGA